MPKAVALPTLYQVYTAPEAIGPTVNVIGVPAQTADVFGDGQPDSSGHRPDSMVIRALCRALDDLPSGVCVYPAPIRLGLECARPNPPSDEVGWSSNRVVVTDPSLAV